MPGGDGTGPAGMGPMTGRAAGFCAGYPMPGYMNPVMGRGFGFGRGRGLGRGFRGGQGYFGAPYGMPAFGYGAPAYGAPPMPYAVPYGMAPSPGQEADMLKGQAEYFKDALEGIGKRIKELEAEKK